jgi:hypothetical protein
LTTTTAVSADVCREMINSLKAIAADPIYGPKLLKVMPRRVIDGGTDADCQMVSREGTVANTDGQVGIQSYGVTYGFWKQWEFYFGGWSVWQWHVNVGIKWTDATHYTKMWGADCYLTTVPGYFGGYDQGGWCGIYNPQIPDTAQPGSNWWVSTYALPTFKRWFWMRYWAYSDGRSSAVWGGAS